MDEGLGCLVGVFSFLVLLYLVAITAGYAVSAMYWAVASVSYALIALLDGLFSVRAMPDSPAVMWAVWGGVMGGVLGFWTIAPVYGMRRWRSAMVLVVLAAMAGTALFPLVSFRGAPAARVGTEQTGLPVARVDADDAGDAVFRVNASALQVQIDFMGEVWLEVKSDGKVVYSGTRRAQDAPLLVTGSRVWMRLGRPQNVVLTINGHRQARLPATDPRNVVVKLAAPTAQ